MHLNLNIRVLPCCEASQLRDPSTRSNRVLETTARLRNVFEESKYIEQVGLAGGVRSRDENSEAEFDVNRAEIPPIFQNESGDMHRLSSVQPIINGLLSITANFLAATS